MVEGNGCTPELSIVQLQRELADEILGHLGMTQRDLDALQRENIRAAIAHYTITIREEL